MNPLIPIQELNREYKRPSFIIRDFGRIFVLSGVVLDSYYFLVNLTPLLMEIDF